MNKKIFLLLTLIFTLTIFSAVNAQEIWRLDGEPDILPRNFRIMDDKNFYASASGQPTLSELKNIFDEIKKVAPNPEKIYIVDLRQESHGFADDYPISWYIKKNRVNVGKSPSRIEFEEKKLFANLRGKLTEFVPLGNYDTAHFKAVKFAPKNTFTEKIAAEAAGLKYVRFYALDMTFPAPEVVDEYLKFLSQIDSDAWLHFHCQAGHGRTTTFLVIYDILKHPDLSLENIVQRQYSLGGSNLFENEEYEKNIRLFYEYAHENSPQSWSQWLMKRGN